VVEARPAAVRLPRGGLLRGVRRWTVVGGSLFVAGYAAHALLPPPFGQRQPTATPRPTHHLLATQAEVRDAGAHTACLAKLSPTPFPRVLTAAAHLRRAGH
jgi:hypothetical protein